MKEFKGTKGEWKISGERYSNRAMIHLGDNRCAVDLWRLETSDITIIQLEANAKLIAAAPDLLEALQSAIPHLEQYATKVALPKALAAIIKALGS